MNTSRNTHDTGIGPCERREKGREVDRLNKRRKFRVPLKVKEVVHGGETGRLN